MPKKKKDKIDFDSERYSMFAAGKDFDVDLGYGREYLRVDSPFYINYYRINILKSNVDDLYNEATPDDKKFFPPIKLNVMFDIEESELRLLSDVGINRSDTGPMKFGVFEEELKQHQLDMTIGDFVSINMSGTRERFFEVSKADYVADDTKKSWGGFRTGYWREVTAIPVKEDVIPQIMN